MLEKILQSLINPSQGTARDTSIRAGGTVYVKVFSNTVPAIAITDINSAEVAVFWSEADNTYYAMSSNIPIVLSEQTNELERSIAPSVVEVVINAPFRIVARDFLDDPNNQYIFGGNNKTQPTDMESNTRNKVGLSENIDNSVNTGFIFLAYRVNSFEWQWYLEGTESSIIVGTTAWTKYTADEYGYFGSFDFSFAREPIAIYGYSHIALVNRLWRSLGRTPLENFNGAGKLNQNITTDVVANCGDIADRPTRQTCLNNNSSYFTETRAFWTESLGFCTDPTFGLQEKFALFEDHDAGGVYNPWTRTATEYVESSTSSVAGTTVDIDSDIEFINDWTATLTGSFINPDCSNWGYNATETSDLTADATVSETITAPVEWVFNDQIIGGGTVNYTMNYSYTGVTRTSQLDYSVDAVSGLLSESDSFSHNVGSYSWTKSASITSIVQVCNGLQKTTALSSAHTFTHTETASQHYKWWAIADITSQWVIDHDREEYYPLREFKEIALYAKREWTTDFQSDYSATNFQISIPFKNSPPQYSGFLGLIWAKALFTGNENQFPIFGPDPLPPLPPITINETILHQHPNSYPLYEEHIVDKDTSSDDLINLNNTWTTTQTFSGTKHTDFLAKLNLGTPFSEAGATTAAILGVYNLKSYYDKWDGDSGVGATPVGTLIRDPLEDAVGTSGTLDMYYVYLVPDVDVEDNLIYFGEGTINYSLATEPDPVNDYELVSNYEMSSGTDMLSPMLTRLNTASGEGEHFIITASYPEDGTRVWVRKNNIYRRFNLDNINIQTVQRRRTILGYHSLEESDLFYVKSINPLFDFQGPKGFATSSSRTGSGTAGVLLLFSKDNVWAAIRPIVLAAGNVAGNIDPSFNNGRKRQINVSLRKRSDGKYILYIPPALEFAEWQNWEAGLLEGDIPVDAYTFDPNTGNWQPEQEVSNSYVVTEIKGQSISGLSQMGGFGSFGDITN